MLYKTHKIINLTGAAMIMQNYNLSLVEIGISFACVIIGTKLPDIDNPSSTLGRAFPVISKNLKHRQFTHSIYPIALFAIIAAMTMNIYMMAFTFGYAMHVFVDMFSVKSVNLFRPSVRPRERYFGYVTGGKFERRVRKIAWICFILTLIQY